MDIETLRALYDKEQRIEIEYPGVQREVTDRVIREVYPQIQQGWIVYSRLDESNVEETITAEIAYFERLGYPFEWKLFSHDNPPDLKDRLAARGFEIEEEEAVLVLDLESAPAVLSAPVTADVRKITDPVGLDDVFAVNTGVWGEDEDGSGLRDELADTLRTLPDQLSVYAAYVDGQPASSAWIRFPPRTQFASLWGGSTLPQYRGRGLFTALVAVRAQEAKQRGYRYLTVDASPMSRPILEKYGFKLIAMSYPCMWYLRA